jgi:hypothetical protein
MIKRLAGMGLRALATRVDGQPTTTQHKLPTVRQPPPPPYEPPEYELSPELEQHPAMQAMKQMMAWQTREIVNQNAERLRALGDNINVTTTHLVDRSHHDNRIFKTTTVDSRHIEAKNRLHPDWGWFWILLFLLALAIIGSFLQHYGIIPHDL